jgi:hypothetical protein
MTNLIIFEGLMIGAPILFLAGRDPASYMLIHSLLVSIICLGVLMPMFVPKFNKVKDEKAKRHVANATSEGVAPATSGGGNVGNIRTDRGGNVTSATCGVTDTVKSIADAS